MHEEQEVEVEWGSIMNMQIREGEEKRKKKQELEKESGSALRFT